MTKFHKKKGTCPYRQYITLSSVLLMFVECRDAFIIHISSNLISVIVKIYSFGIIGSWIRCMQTPD